MRLHASAVAVAGKGVLILGASGTGKSALALQLMAYGAQLVSDDQTVIRDVDGWPVACSPDEIRGAIEARGIGLLAAEALPSARIALAVDMDKTESERLPPERNFALPGRPVVLLHKLESPYFAAAILQYIKAGKARL